MGEWKEVFLQTFFTSMLDVSGRLHTPAALLLEKTSLAAIV